MAVPVYDFRIDWDEHEAELLSNGNFEVTVDPWVAAGTNPPTIARSDVRAYDRVVSLLVTWATASVADAPRAQVDIAGTTSGSTYTMQAWVFVPAGMPAVKLVVVDAGGTTTGANSTVTDAWQFLTLTWTSGGTTATLRVQNGVATTAGQTCFVDEVRAKAGNLATREGVTNRVLDRHGVASRVGRDQARERSPISAGSLSFGLDNVSRDYSPDNTSSPLANYVQPGVGMNVRATHAGVDSWLFQGFIDEITLAPELEDRSVSITAQDRLAQFQSFNLSTQLYPSAATHDAINVILNEIGWPLDRRVIDGGATTLRWWSEEDTDALTAIRRVVDAEGPGAAAFIGADGAFVFHSRHHRITSTPSITSQATFRDTGVEPKFSRPLGYDLGWRDVANSVIFTVNERDPGLAGSKLWEDKRVVTFAAGETKAFAVKFDNPSTGLMVPTTGAEDAAETFDVAVLSGTITPTLSRLSGQSVVLSLKAGATAATVTRMRVRGTPVTTMHSIKVTGEEAESIALHGLRALMLDVPHLNREDAAALVLVYLGKLSTRRPTVRMRLVAKDNDTRLTQQLQRDLADRVTIVDAETGLNTDFHIEQISHSIKEGGLILDTVFGCEKVVSQVATAFTFDVAGKGFNDGTFGRQGFDSATTVFLFDHATQGQFDVGLFGH